ncbi:MAG: UDP-N-acetylglucosamine 1-carboxyvinyltransferase [Ruminococcus sp.]|jgi:UDP-N-acetylglucosamine 1-carboxyvinyltransferase|nr:UDP-N-acetylglucosamine 1-carboxyvinyltransferase [Ruminococcus sp.]
MRKFIVSGGKKLEGEISVQGAKNSVLPVIAAATLCDGNVIIKNAPDISDTYFALQILNHLGAKTTFTANENTIAIDSTGVRESEIPDKLMKKIRSSIFFLGAILGRTGRCRISQPGGCDIGLRPIDMHISALKQMGVKVIHEEEHLDFIADKGITGAKINLVFPSVGATENIIMAAVTAVGTTIISNAAREPEVVDLVKFLNAAGAKIKTDASGRIIIKGVPKLTGCEFKIMPDRIAAATYLACAASTGGMVTIRDCNTFDLDPILPIFTAAGCKVYTYDTSVTLSAGKKLTSPHSLIKTLVHPGFPTDAQAVIMGMLTRAEGVTVFEETIFENRYRHVPELTKFGADIIVSGKIAVVTGVPKLHAAKAESTDLRGGAGIITAALAAEGRSEISLIEYIDRGYEDFEGNLKRLGAEIQRSS